MKRNFVNLYLSFIFIIALASCKKDKKTAPSQNINYQIVNKTVKASDLNPLTLDANNDGKIDYTFFAVYSVNNNGVDLNVGINPIGYNLAIMGLANDDKFLNMSELSNQAAGTLINQNIKENQLWSNDFAYLTIRTETNNGNKSYIGAWSNNTPQLMAFQLNVNGEAYYGWARLAFNRTTEVLTLIDFAYNRTANEEIKAAHNK